LAAGLLVSIGAFAVAEEPAKSGGWLREKIKKRILKRVEEKPAT
jgi:hypothetical protein